MNAHHNPNSSSRSLRALAAAAILAAATGPGFAFQSLHGAVVALPDTAAASGPVVFEFVSPAAVASWKIRDRPAIGSNRLRATFLRPLEAATLTGIDFRNLDGMLQFGEPPTAVRYLAGRWLSEFSVAMAFRERRLSESREGAATVFAAGEDGAVDRQSVNPADPFADGIGVSQRVAVAAGRVVVARDWASLRTGLPMLADEPMPTYLGARAASMVAAASAAAGPGMVAHTAIGLSLAAINRIDAQAPGEPLDFGKAIDAGEHGLPAYHLAMLIAAEAEDGSSAGQIILYYPTLADAEAGATGVADRLRAEATRQERDAVYEQRAIGDGPGAIGVVTVRFPAVPGEHASNMLMRRWQRAIAQGRFPPLSIRKAADMVAIEGTIALAEPADLAESTGFRIRLVELAGPADEPRVVESVRIVRGDRALPLPFRIAVEPAALAPDRRYAIEVRVGSDGRYETIEPVPVDPRAAAPVAVSVAPSPSRALRNTLWRLAPAEGEDGRAISLRFNSGLNVTVQAGCRGIRARSAAMGWRIQFDRISRPDDDCSRAEGDRRIRDVLERTRRFALEGEALVLAGADGGVLARFTPD